MHNVKFPYRLYLVVSQADCKLDMLEVVEEAILGGVDIVQFREKNLNTEYFIQKALEVKGITDKFHIPLIINDNLDVAMAVNAFGIHVGNSDIAPTYIKEKWKNCQSIGYSIEYLEQLENKETIVADSLGISPVYRTPTKKDTVTEWGIEGIRKIRQITEKPLIAIGGIQTHNVRNIIKAGADCIAVVSAISSADNPRMAASQLKNEILKAL